MKIQHVTLLTMKLQRSSIFTIDYSIPVLVESEMSVSPGSV